MGLERSRRPGILNLQSFRGSETLLRGYQHPSRICNLSAKILWGVRGVVFCPCACVCVCVCATAGLRTKVPPQRFQLLVLQVHSEKHIYAYMRHSCLESPQQPKNKRKVWNVPKVQNCHSNLSVTVSTPPKFCNHLPPYS